MNKGDAKLVRNSEASSPRRKDAAAEETLRLVHELQVHQVELEVQNEELLRAQAELEASRARYFDLYDQAPVGYVTVSGEGLILEANLTAATLLGVRRDALAKRPFSGFVHPDDQDTFREQRAHFGEREPRHSWDMRMKRADGSPCWVHLQAALTRDGEWRIALNDISERKRTEATLAVAEARLRQLQKAESLGRMAGAIAHHFNNKLQAVIGNLELCLQDPPRDTRSVSLLDDSMQAALQAAEVSTLMLTFTGQAAGNHRPLDLSQACRRLQPLLRAALPATLLLELRAPEPGLIVNAHEEHLPQLLANLVANAGEAVGTGTGAVRLTVRTVSAADIPDVHRFPVDWAPQGTNFACLEVMDTGRGISDSDLDRIFDPFYSDKAAGRGLGLSVVLGIARAHGGAVSVRSTPGLGSTFQVFLPLAPGAAAPPLPEKTSQAAAGQTVLLVEDEDLVRSMTVKMLSGLGFSVISAARGSEAVVELDRHRAKIRLVLCDLSMPGMNGWETLTALRAIVPDIPVILCSGHDRVRALAGHHPQLPQAFLRKPYRLADLSDAVRSVLGTAATPGRPAAVEPKSRTGVKVSGEAKTAVRMKEGSKEPTARPQGPGDLAKEG